MKYFIYCRKSSEAEDRQVLSIESQVSELRTKFAGDPNIEIIEVLEEAFSAKAPGRPIFDAMMQRIEKGEAEGIIAWHPDRLARNSVDGGRIIYLLDGGALKDLKFSTFSFENNPQGKFMLSIIFGYSKYYVDNLSENVKRGNRSKVARGWRPNRAPIGYRNCKDTKTIVVDPEHFRAVRQIFALMLLGTYTVTQIRNVLNNEQGYRTPRYKRIGGSPLAHSTAYQILTNPFYAGYILWNGEMHPGKHPPVVTLAEFDRVQELLGRPRRNRAQRHEFAYTGLLTCGACGLSVTAEHKQNRFGTRYIYYHCTRRHRSPRCQEPSIEITALEEQIAGFLDRVYVPDTLHQWALMKLKAGTKTLVAERTLVRRNLDATIADTQKQLSTLTDLRIRAMIGDEEYGAKRSELTNTLLRLRESLTKTPESLATFEPHELLLTFSNRAVDWYATGNERIRRTIVKTVSSNPTLMSKKLSLEARKPFRERCDPPVVSVLRAGTPKVPTPSRRADRARITAMLTAATQMRDTPELIDIVKNIKWLIDQCESQHREVA